MNILITGAASGIGKATAEYFINNNHQVIGIDINNIENGKALPSMTVFFYICEYFIPKQDMYDMAEKLPNNKI